MPSITPAQRVFGIGVQPLEKMFRPPAGMEYDPAYNDFGRRTWAQEDLNDAQRESVLAQTELARAQRDQLKADLATRSAEDAAFAEMKKRPDEIPNILRSFPELARSKNFDNVLQYAQAVQPNAAQKTLSASLRNRLKPHERQYFDEHFGQNGNAVSAFDAAQLRGEHEAGLVDMMKGGVPLDVIDKYRDRPLSPLEREALIQQHSKKPEDENEFARKKALEYLFSQGGYDLTKPEEFTRMQSDAANIHKLFPPTRQGAQPVQPPAIATQDAKGGVVAPAGAVATPIQTQAAVPVIQQPQAAPVITPETHIKALEEALAKPAPEGLLPIEIARQRKQIADKLAEAKDNLEVDKIAQKHVAPIYDDEKRHIDSVVDEYAKEFKMPASAVWDAIVAKSPLPVRNQNASFGEDSPYYLDAASGMVVATPSLALFGDQAESVNPKFQKALQLLRTENAKKHPFSTFFRSIGNEFTPPTKAQILADYAKEKAASARQSLPAAQSHGSVAGQPKIEIGKPRKVQ